MRKYLVEYVVEYFDGEEERKSMDVYAESGFEALSKTVQSMTPSVVLKRIRGFYVTDVVEY